MFHGSPLSKLFNLKKAKFCNVRFSKDANIFEIKFNKGSLSYL